MLFTQEALKTLGDLHEIGSLKSAQREKVTLSFLPCSCHHRDFDIGAAG